jgi:hypothetical protein
MFDKVREIGESWIIANNPSEAQLKLAEARLDICTGCDKMVKGTLVEFKCSECGCPIHKKIFSPKFDACPLHKWLDVENTNLYTDTQKKSKSFL